MYLSSHRMLQEIDNSNRFQLLCRLHNNGVVYKSRCLFYWMTGGIETTSYHRPLYI